MNLPLSTKKATTFSDIRVLLTLGFLENAPIMAELMCVLIYDLNILLKQLI